jgi:excisionase family DNA binding protein
MGGPDVTQKPAKQLSQHCIIDTMTVREVATYLRVHSSTIYRLLHQRKIPAFKVGYDWRFSREAINDWCLSVPLTHETVDNLPNFAADSNVRRRRLEADSWRIRRSLPGGLYKTSEEARSGIYERMRFGYADPQHLAQASKGSSLPANMRLEIVKLLRKQGLSSSSVIANVVGVSTTTVKKVAKQAGIILPTAARRTTANIKRPLSQ